MLLNLLWTASSSAAFAVPTPWSVSAFLSKSHFSAVMAGMTSAAVAVEKLISFVGFSKSCELAQHVLNKPPLTCVECGWQLVLCCIHMVEQRCALGTSPKHIFAPPAFAAYSMHYFTLSKHLAVVSYHAELECHEVANKQGTHQRCFAGTANPHSQCNVCAMEGKLARLLSWSAFLIFPASSRSMTCTLVLSKPHRNITTSNVAASWQQYGTLPFLNSVKLLVAAGNLCPPSEQSSPIYSGSI